MLKHAITIIGSLNQHRLFDDRPVHPLNSIGNGN